MECRRQVPDLKRRMAIVHALLILAIAALSQDAVAQRSPALAFTSLTKVNDRGGSVTYLPTGETLVVSMERRDNPCVFGVRLVPRPVYPAGVPRCAVLLSHRGECLRERKVCPGA